MVFIFLSSIVEVFAVFSLVPIILAAANPASETGDKILQFYLKFLPIDKENAIPVILLLTLVYFIVKNLFQWFVQIKIATFSQKIALKVTRNNLVDYFNKELNATQEEGSGNLIRMGYSVPEFFAKNYTVSLLMLLSESIVLVLLFLVIFSWDPKLFLLVSITILPLAYFSYRTIRGRIKANTEEKKELQNIFLKNLVETSRSKREIQLFGFTENNIDELVHIASEIQKRARKADILRFIPPKVIETSAVLIIILIFLLVYFNINDSNAMLVTIGIYAAASFRIIPSLTRIISSATNANAYKYTLNEVQLGNENTVFNRSVNPTKSIRLNDVFFNYDNSTPIFENISLKLDAGFCTGIVGKSGDGKTTLINLLLGLYPNTRGEFLVDGQNLHMRNVKCAYVGQEPIVFNNTLGFNVTFENNYDSDKVKQALLSAGLSDWELDKIIEEGGSNISGGQKQRINIARAIYFNCNFFLFDEPSASLDKHTEGILVDLINELKNHNKIVLLTTHRDGLLKACDFVYTIENKQLKPITQAF